MTSALSFNRPPERCSPLHKPSSALARVSLASHSVSGGVSLDDGVPRHARIIADTRPARLRPLVRRCAAAEWRPRLHRPRLAVGPDAADIIARLTTLRRLHVASASCLRSLGPTSSRRRCRRSESATLAANCPQLRLARLPFPSVASLVLLIRCCPQLGAVDVVCPYTDAADRRHLIERLGGSEGPWFVTVVPADGAFAGMAKRHSLDI